MSVLPRWRQHIDSRSARDIFILAGGFTCITTQIILSVLSRPVSGELVVAGVTLLTATPFLWKGDERTDADNRGRHEARS